MSLWMDLKFALRLMRQGWGFSLAVISILALAIGANTAIFSGVQAIFLRDLPYPQSDRLVHMWAYWPGGYGNMAYLDYQAMIEQNTTFDGIAAYESWGNAALTGGDRPVQLTLEFVTPSYFSILGAKVRVGRLFREDENVAEGGHPMAVLSQALWQRQYAADPTIVGRVIRLNGAPYTVIGVLDAGFRDLGEVEEPARDVFLPTMMARAVLGQAPIATSPTQIYWALGRLKPGVTIAQARENLRAISARLAKEHTETHRGQGLDLEPLMQRVNGPLRGPVAALAGGALLVLLICCANIANSLLFRLTQRHHELAVRAALGASQGRVVQQLLVENAVLGVAGGALGLLLAMWALPVLNRLAARHASLLAMSGLNFGALVAAVVLTLATLFLFGVLPALRGTQGNVGEVLKQGGRQGSMAVRGAMRSGLVIAEVALAIVLVTGAGLMLRSVRTLAAAPLGFRTANMLTFRLSLNSGRYRDDLTRIQFTDAFDAAVKAVPGVDGVTLLGPSMLSHATWVLSLFPNEQQPKDPGDFVMMFRHSINPGGLENLGIGLREGREFTKFDSATAPLVAILSESAARAMWPHESAIGKQVRRADPAMPPITVVGVVADARHRQRYSLGDIAEGLAPGGLGPQKDVYLPYPQRANIDATFAVRLSGDPAGATDSIRAVLRRLDPDLPMSDVRMLQDRLAEDEGAAGSLAMVLGAYAAFSLFLAALGVYSVMSQWVGQRTQEIGIRVAMGASARDILTLVLGRGTVLILTGVAVGMVGSLWLSRLLEGLLYGVSRTDPLTLVSVPGILLAVGMAACYVPVRRALLVDPVTALRNE